MKINIFLFPTTVVYQFSSPKLFGVANKYFGKLCSFCLRGMARTMVFSQADPGINLFKGAFEITLVNCFPYPSNEERREGPCSFLALLLYLHLLPQWYSIETDFGIIILQENFFTSQYTKCVALTYNMVLT